MFEWETFIIIIWIMMETSLVHDAHFLMNLCTQIRFDDKMLPLWALIQYKITSYQYRKFHCGDKTVVRSSDLHNGISYTGKMVSLHWFSPQYPVIHLPAMQTTMRCRYNAVNFLQYPSKRHPTAPLLSGRAMGESFKSDSCSAVAIAMPCVISWDN